MLQLVRARGVALLALGWVLVGGCTRAGFFLGADAAAVDGAGEGRAGDLARDAVVDAPQDSAWDRPAELAVDGAADAAADGGSDAPGDGASDAGPEAASGDLGGEALSTPACAAGVTEIGATPTSSVALCEGATAYNQCGAHVLCNEAGGWSLCPASVYRAEVTAAFGISGWISGCVRAHDDPFAPVDGRCASCTSASGEGAQTIWSCSGSPVAGTVDLNIGLTSYNGCFRVGANVPEAAGYWLPSSSATTSNRAVCCRP